MTNQSKPIFDTNSGLTVIARPESLLVSPNRYFTKKQLLKKLGNNNSLLETMRATSPTGRATEDPTSWTAHHPSALAMFDDIMGNSLGKQIVVFLDYDGTLSPIVDDPDCAFMTNEMREVVRDVAKFFPAAIVSGRCQAKVYDFVRLPELFYAGSHGMDITGPSTGRGKGNQSVLCQPAREFLPMVDEMHKSLVEITKHIPGAIVENNKFCLSVHYRCVEETRWAELDEEVKLVVNEYPQLRMSKGRKVLEVRPMIKWDKGNAVEFLLESLGYMESDHVFPVYIGDDRTDEDAFRVLQNMGQGIGILVSGVPKETSASYTLQEPSEVMQFLRLLVEWHERRGVDRRVLD